MVTVGVWPATVTITINQKNIPALGRKSGPNWLAAAPLRNPENYTLSRLLTSKNPSMISRCTDGDFQYLNTHTLIAQKVAAPRAETKMLVINAP